MRRIDMIRYKNILVAFDGSADSNRALEVAETFATDHGAKLNVVYVHDKSLQQTVNYEESLLDNDIYSNQPEPYIGTGSMPIRPEIPAQNKKAVIHDTEPDKILSDARSKLKNDEDVTFEALIGAPAHAISEYAKDNDIDLTVIGNRGLSGMKKLVMGSVSQRVTNNAGCAVLVVK